jgi:mevalonate pyrophosphate decarboxylase
MSKDIVDDLAKHVINKTETALLDAFDLVVDTQDRFAISVLLASSSIGFAAAALVWVCEANGHEISKEKALAAIFEAISLGMAKEAAQ